MVTITIEMFGGFTVRLDNQPSITRFRSQRTASLLAYLACHRKKPNSREVVAGMFWPDSDAAQARGNLSVALTSLRKLLEPLGIRPGTFLETDPASIGLSSLVVTDVGLFENLLARASRLSSDDPSAMTMRRQAMEIYHGPLLPASYEDWACEERNRLDGLAATALCILAQDALSQGDRTAATTYARRAFEANSLCRGLTTQLMDLLPKGVREGISLLEAPTVFKRGGGRPRKEEPRQPAAETRSSTATATATATPPVINVFQPPVTPLFGRDRERERAADLLRNPAVRILTLAGPGGVGKTRLAHALTLDLPAMLPGAHVCAVPIADLRSADSLLNVIAGAVGASQRSLENLGHDSASVADVARLLSGYPGRVILIVDNLEQIAHEAAPILRDLIGAASNLTCVLTSRQLLPPNSSGIIPIGERTLQVEPLPVPPPALLEGPRDSLVPIEAQLESWSSVALFVDRARRHNPDFALTSANAAALGMVVRRLEGLPLAIELAAARSQRFTPAHLLDSLSCGFDEITTLGARTNAHRESVYARHDSLRQTIQWSFDLLSATQRRVFTALSVFRGGFAVEEAIKTIANDGDLSESAVFDAVADLCDASLLRRLPIADAADSDSGKLLPPRYDMLEPIREFASRQFAPGEQEIFQSRHAASYEALAIEAAKHAQSHGSEWWLQRGGAEQGNFRIALSWAAESSTREAARVGVSLASELDRLYLILGNISEGRAHLRKAMNHPLAPSAIDVTAEADAHNRAGILAMTQGDARDAVEHYEKALALWRSAGNKAGIAGALNNLAIMASSQGRLDDTWNLLTESLGIWRTLGSEANVAITTANLGNLAIDRNDLRAARELIEEAIGLARSAGDNRGAAISLRNLGEVYLRQSDVPAAGRQYVAALELVLPMRDIQGCAACLMGLGVVADRSGRGRRSARLVQTAVRAYHALSVPAPSFFLQALPNVDFNEIPAKADTEEAAQAVLIMGRLELEMAADEAEMMPRQAPLALSRSFGTLVGAGV